MKTKKFYKFKPIYITFLFVVYKYDSKAYLFYQKKVSLFKKHNLQKKHFVKFLQK